MRGDEYQLGRRPELDGIRAIAVLFVMAFHAKLPYAPSGATIGVTMFFVLSGFLITRLLVEEKQRSGLIDYRAFYMRRLRRLAPAMVTLLLATTVILLVKGMPLLPELAAALYVANIASASGLDLGLVGHTWTLSLEEQFYLLWPPLMLLATRTRRAPLILAAAAAISTITRVLIWETTGNFNRVWFAPDTRADALLIGCIIGLTIHRTNTWRCRNAIASVSILVLLGATVFASQVPAVWLLLPMAIASAAIINWAVSGTRLSPGRRALGALPLRYLGRISYGLYLWHYPIMYIAFSINPHRIWAVAAITFPLSIAMAAASWRLIEQPFMKRAGVERVVPPGSVRSPAGEPAGWSTGGRNP